MIPQVVARLLAHSCRLPLFSFRVPAGFPSPAQDHLERSISLDEILDIRAPHTYLVRAAGDSMVRAGIFDGDLLVVNRSREAVSNDIVIAAVNAEPTVKRLVIEGKQVSLYPENPKYAPRYILEGDELLIWGVVDYSIRSDGKR
ncbi:LexA repressor [compost metagenome]